MDEIKPDPSELLDRLENRRRRFTKVSELPTPTDDAINRVKHYTREYPVPTLAGAVLGGLVLGRLVRTRGAALLLPVALTVVRQQVLPKLVGKLLAGRKAGAPPAATGGLPAGSDSFGTVPPSNGSGVDAAADPMLTPSGAAFPAERVPTLSERDPTPAP